MSEWYFTQDGKSLGPVSEAELVELAANGKLRPTDLVWQDGMPDWIPAGQAKKLWPAGRAPAALDSGLTGRPMRRPPPADAAAEERSRKRRRPDDDDDADRPRRGRRIADEDDDDDFRPRRRTKEGSGNPVIVAVAVAGGVLLLGIVSAVIFLAFKPAEDPDVALPNVVNLSMDKAKALLEAQGMPLKLDGPDIGLVAEQQPAAGNLVKRGTTVSVVMSGAPKKFQLNNGNFVFWHLPFPEKTKVEIRVTSDSDSDVDLFIHDAKEQEVAKDEDTSQHCYVVFVPETTQKYKVVVSNRVRVDEPWRNKPNSGTVTFTMTPGAVAQPLPPIKPGPFVKPPMPPIIDPTPAKAAIPLVAGQRIWNGKLGLADGFMQRNTFTRRCKTYTYPMIAGKTYTIDMKSNSFDAYLYLDDPNGVPLAEDDDSGGGLDARIVHTATKTGNHRITAATLDGRIGSFQLVISP